MIRISKSGNEHAVSPVVGVMLMLVVTIIIAAVVSAFAGGMGGSQEKTPQASIEVKTGYGFNTYGNQTDMTNFDISFEHLGGDPIVTRDVQIITMLTMFDGTVVKHTQDATSTIAATASYTTTPRYARLPFLFDREKYTTSGNSMYEDATYWAANGDSGAWWGRYTFMPGQIARTYKMNATAAFLGLIPDASTYPYTAQAYIDGGALLQGCIQNQTTLEIKWLHKPSGKYILDKKIVLQG